MTTKVADQGRLSRKRWRSENQPTPVASGMSSASTLLNFALLGVSLGGVILLAWSSFSEQLSRVGLARDQAMAARAYGDFTAISKIGFGVSDLLTGAWLNQQTSPISSLSILPLLLSIATLCFVSAAIAWLTLA